MVEHLLMPQWVIGSIPLCGPTELYLIPAIVPQRVYQRPCMYYPDSGMVYTKEPLLLIGKNSPCFHISLSELSFIICVTPYNRKYKCVECLVKLLIAFLPSHILPQTPTDSHRLPQTSTDSHRFPHTPTYFH